MDKPAGFGLLRLRVHDSPVVRLKIAEERCDVAAQAQVKRVHGAVETFQIRNPAQKIHCRLWHQQENRSQVKSLQVLRCTRPGSPNFIVRGPQKLLDNSSRAGHLTWSGCFGICYILPNQQIFRKYHIFSLLTKWFRGPDLETLALDHKRPHTTSRFINKQIYWRRMAQKATNEKARRAPWAVLVYHTIGIV